MNILQSTSSSNFWLCAVCEGCFAITLLSSIWKMYVFQWNVPLQSLQHKVLGHSHNRQTLSQKTQTKPECGGLQPDACTRNYSEILRHTKVNTKGSTHIQLMRQSNMHGLDSRTKGHTEPRRPLPYHYDYQNQPRTQDMQHPTSDALRA